MPRKTKMGDLPAKPSCVLSITNGTPEALHVDIGGYCYFKGKDKQGRATTIKDIYPGPPVGAGGTLPLTCAFADVKVNRVEISVQAKIEGTDHKWDLTVEDTQIEKAEYVFCLGLKRVP